LELLPLWEERCFVNGPETTIFPSNKTNIDLAVPNGADAFVFWLASTDNRPFKFLDDKEVEWDKGTRQWIYFLTNPDLAKLRIKFNFNEQKELPGFVLSDEN
jgi:hypothetical protein